jgi:hypothetical protein
MFPPIIRIINLFLSWNLDHGHWAPHECCSVIHRHLCGSRPKDSLSQVFPLPRVVLEVIIWVNTPDSIGHCLSEVPQT